MVQFTSPNLSFRSSRWNTDAALFSIAAENRCRSRPHADIRFRSSHRFLNQRSTNSFRRQTNFPEVSVSNVMLPGWPRYPPTVELLLEYNFRVNVYRPGGRVIFMEVAGYNQVFRFVLLKRFLGHVCFMVPQRVSYYRAQ